jgi:hypothetical protein
MRRESERLRTMRRNRIEESPRRVVAEGHVLKGGAVVEAGERGLVRQDDDAVATAR